MTNETKYFLRGFVVGLLLFVGITHVLILSAEDHAAKVAKCEVRGGIYLENEKVCMKAESL